MLNGVTIYLLHVYNQIDFKDGFLNFYEVYAVLPSV